MLLAVLQSQGTNPVRREEQNMVFRIRTTALRISFTHLHSIGAVIKLGPAALWIFKLASRLGISDIRS